VIRADHAMRMARPIRSSANRREDADATCHRRRRARL